MGAFGSGQATGVRVTVYPSASSWRMWLRVRWWGSVRRRGVIWAEVVVAGLGLGQQVPDDDQDGTSDCDGGSWGSAAASQASVALAEEGVGARGRDRRLAESLSEVAVAVPGGAAPLVLPGGLVDPGREASPRAQVRRGAAPPPARSAPG